MAKNRTKESIRAYRIGASLVTLFIFLFVLTYVGVPGVGDISYSSSDFNVSATSTPEEVIPEVVHIKTPSAVKGIYMTSCVAATPSLRSNLVKLIDETEINAVVLDVKTFDGYISFEPRDENLKHATGGCFVKDMKEFIEHLHSKDIYVIGRVASFQDALQVKLRPELAVKKATATTTVWRDYKGIPWIDASAQPHREYLVAIAKAAHEIGFDEINFDYIRFPSDGNMKDIMYPWSGKQKKSDVMRSFFEYLHNELSPKGIIISADTFGMTTTNTDDLNIGQILEDALPFFDYIAPMVYPSHYPVGFMNFQDPNKHVYEIVNYSMKVAVERARATTTTVALPGARIGTTTPALYAKPSFDIQKLRPWLQDNNYPVTYTAEMVRAQIQATYDTGLTSWMLWNAGNRYTRAALTEGQ
ncbi:MAG: hypothetical protein RLZZ67_153 [Candidatus Parcubacteria bacterium]